MATYQLQEWCLDEFAGDVDANLFEHVPDYQALPNVEDGGLWWFNDSEGLVLDGEGGIYDGNGGTFTSRIFQVGTYPIITANQFAACTVRIIGAPNNGAHAGVAVRCQSGNGNCYALLYDAQNHQWQLIKRTPGPTNTVLATYSGAAQAIANGGRGSCSLAIEGTTLKPVTMGVIQTPVTDGVITLAGFPAPSVLPNHADTASTGIHVEKWLCGYLP